MLSVYETGINIFQVRFFLGIVQAVVITAFCRNPLFRYINVHCDLPRIAFEKDVKLEELLRIHLLESVMMVQAQPILDQIRGLKQQAWTEVSQLSWNKVFKTCL